ncbi:MAG: hypothetical protein ACLU4N_17245 [Butyricimonas faecihominis]
MRKPSFKLFRELTARFNAINNKEHLKQQIIPTSSRLIRDVA